MHGLSLVCAGTSINAVQSRKCERYGDLSLSERGDHLQIEMTFAG